MAASHQQTQMCSSASAQAAPWDYATSCWVAHWQQLTARACDCLLHMPKARCDAVAAHRQHPKAVLNCAGRALTAANGLCMQLSPTQAQMSFQNTPARLHCVLLNRC